MYIWVWEEAVRENSEATIMFALFIDLKALDFWQNGERKIMKICQKKKSNKGISKENLTDI